MKNNYFISSSSARGLLVIVLTTLLGAAFFCRQVFASNWTENTLVAFSSGDFVNYTTTAAADNTVTINKIVNWYDSSWLLRKTITIDNTSSGQTLTGYQQEIIIDAQSLVNSSLMRADLADIRFTDTDGKSLLPYYIASSTASSSTGIYVKVPSIPANQVKTIYMYFDNLSTTTSNSSAKNTFDLYEDWESGSISGFIWQTGGDSNWSVVSSTAYQGNYSAQSGNLMNDFGGVSYIETTINLEMAACLTFYWSISGQWVYDNLSFYIDGVQTTAIYPYGASGISGLQPWTIRVYNIPAGQHTLMWQYQRSPYGGTQGSETGWLDNIILSKQASIPPVATVESSPENYSFFFKTGIFQSDVLDAGGQQAQITFASWSYMANAGTSLTMKMRDSDTQFYQQDASPAWSVPLTNNTEPLISKGRFIQYQATLSGDGTTTPYLVEVSVNYQSPPLAPTNFTGLALSTSSIEWTWTDNSYGEAVPETGFRLYSSTGGIIASLAADVTWYVENNLQPNEGLCEWVGAYNAIGTNLSSAATIYTYADPPVNHSEIFQLGAVSGYSYVPIPTRTDIFQTTFTFTSDESTTTIAYYRVAFTTNPAYSITSADKVWVPSTTVVYDNSFNPITRKSETYFWPLVNSTSWYFYSETYNVQNLPGGITRLGPYSFQGCPTIITDLTAAPSTNTEGEIVLTWTSPSAYGTQVTNLTNGSYILKAKTSFYISNDTVFNNADMSFTISTSAIAGQKQSFTLTGLVPGSFWGFAIKSVNSDNNISQISSNITTSTNTASYASVINKIVFITSPQTTYVGSQTGDMTVQTFNIDDIPLKVAANTTLNLNSTSSSRSFGQGSTWGLTSITIPQGGSQVTFQYEDTNSGNPTITVSESPSKGWIDATQTETIIPGKAVRFMVDDTPGSGNVGVDQTITIRANDGYNPANTSSDYRGDIVATCTVAGLTITPSTHSFTSSDTVPGKTQFIIRNGGNNSIAGPVTYSVQEVIDQDYKDVQNNMLVGNGGIIKSRNTSAQWFAEVYSSGSANALFGVSSPDGVNIWASGSSGRVVASTNSGTNWNAFSTGLSSNLNGIFFVNASTGWVVGDGGNIVKSMDGGSTWSAPETISPSIGTTKIHSVYFINVSTGWAVGDSGILLQTTNSGQTWQSASLGSGNLNKIFFCSDLLTGYVAADGGIIYKTANGGANWVPQTTPITSNLYSINFFSPTFGYAAGASNTILKTSNGGQTWSLAVSTAAAPDFYGISYVGSNINEITAVGTGGSILQTTDGSTWVPSVMSGVSTPFMWNALVITRPVVQAPATGLVQGRTNPGLYVGVYTTNSGASTVNQIVVKRSDASTCADADIASMMVYRDNNGNGTLDAGDTFVGGGAFSGGLATIPCSLSFTGTTSYFLIMPNVTLNSGSLGQTFGMELDFADTSRFLNVNSGIGFAQNNLPFVMSPVTIIPSSCTVSIGVGNLSPTQVTQGQQNVFIASFTMTTDRGNSPWSRLIVARNGINNRDSDIQSINIYRSQDSSYLYNTLIATAAFGTVVPGYAYISNIGETIYNTTTNYYLLEVNISPTAAYYTPTSDARFWLSFNMSSNSFILDGVGANGVQSSTTSFTSNQMKILQAFNTLTVVPSALFPASVNVDQSQVACLEPLLLSVQQAGAQVNITKIHVTETGTASDSDVENVQFYRSADGTQNFNSATAPVLLGSGVLSSGKGDIILTNPEIISTPLPGFATYFIAASVYKRAVPGDAIQLKLDSSDISLAGVNVVSAANFPVYTSTAAIQFHRDYVNVTLTDISPREARVNDTGIVMTKMKLWVACTASLTNLTLNLTGNGSASNVSAIKLYTNADNSDVFASTGTLIGSGAFNSLGVSSITFTTPLTVYDSSSTVFVTYDFNTNGTPAQTVGMGVSNSAFTASPPEYGFNFGGGVSGGYFQTEAVNLLRKETPSVPALALDIGYPEGIQSGGQTVYCSNQASNIGFVWQAQALNGIAQAKYALASFSVFSTTSVPDLTGWSATASTTTLMRGLNLKHDTIYYLWVEAVSKDGFERVTSVPLLIDLTAPSTPVKPTDTSPKSNSVKTLLANSKTLTDPKADAVSSYWVSWQPASDPESGIWYYELQERTDTSPVWHIVSTTTATGYYVVKSTDTDEGKFFYYRVSAMNYAGSPGSFSDSSVAAYLSLPSGLVKDLASYPNPFDSRRKNATITFVLNQDAVVIFKVYDLFGKLVKQWQITGAAGDNTSTWDGTDDGGRKVAAGMYILYSEIQGSGQTVKKKYKIGVIH